MEKFLRLMCKNSRLVIGLMSGTSIDGIDAAIVRIDGKGIDSKVELIHFKNFPFDDKTRNNIFKMFDLQACRIDYISYMNFLMGELFAKAVISIVKDAGMKLEQIDLIGSHGLTVYHMPKPIIDDGFEIRSTLQIGEPSVISERTGIVTVADFRVRDVAAGGEGAPLVPYTEYILYRDKDKSIGLQNIGGIANITVLPKDCSIEDVYAFDNGPGNMIIDQLVSRITNNKMKCDVNGDIARQGTVNQQLLDILMNDDYLQRKPPKTTGREYFGQSFGDRVIDISKSIGISENDLVATATAYTAKAIGQSCKEFIIPSTGLDKLIIGGGGSYNRTLVKMIKSFLPNVLVLTQEDIGLNSDAKEAIAFAILANETINGNYNNVPGATGANKKVVMGKIII